MDALLNFVEAILETYVFIQISKIKNSNKNL